MSDKKAVELDMKALRWIVIAQEDIAKAEGEEKFLHLRNAMAACWKAFGYLEDAVKAEKP